MCGVEWIAAGSAIVGIAGAKAQYDATKAEGAASVAQLREQQRLARLRADEALRVGAESAHTQRVSIGQFIGAQRAQIGGSGVDVNIGSSADIQVEAAVMGEMDALQIEDQASKESLAFSQEANLFGIAAETAGKTTGVNQQAAILSGLGSVFDAFRF